MSRATSADNATATAMVATASQTISVRAIVPLARLQGALLPLVGRSILTDRGDRGKTGRRQRGVGGRPAGSQPGGETPRFFRSGLAMPPPPRPRPPPRPLRSGR